MAAQWVDHLVALSADLKADPKAALSAGLKAVQ
jgi:hypothetical protein